MTDGAPPPKTEKPDKPKMGTPKVPEARPMKRPEGSETKPPADAKAETKPPAPVEEKKGPTPDKDGVTKLDSPGKNRGKLIEPSLDAVDAIEADTLVIHLASDVRPLAGLASHVDWRMCGHLSQLIQRGVITGQKGEVVLLPTHGRIPPGRIFVFGWGPSAGMLDGATDRIKQSLEVLAKAKVQKMAVVLPEPAGRLIGLVDEHLVKPLGDKLACVFAPDGLAPDVKKDTRPIPAPAL